MFDFFCNCWTEFDMNWQETISQCYRANRKTKMEAPTFDWLSIFGSSFENPEWNLMKLDRKQVLNMLYHVCVFGPIGKKRLLPRPLIGWDTFVIIPDTTERNLTTLGSKPVHVLNAIYHVFIFFRADRKTTTAVPTSDLLMHFRLFFCYRIWIEFDETWLEESTQRPLPSLCISCQF